jgi:hypothetical protein
MIALPSHYAHISIAQLMLPTDLAILDAVQPQPTTPLPILATIVPELKKRQGNGDNDTVSGNGDSQSDGNGNVSNSSNPHGLSQSDKIAIGVGVGGGVVAIIGVYYTYRQFKQHSKAKARHQPTSSAMPSSQQSQHYGYPWAGSHSFSAYRNELPT